jgi:diguanylate cyclase (GGDEF)-like protein
MRGLDKGCGALLTLTSILSHRWRGGKSKTLDTVQSCCAEIHLFMENTEMQKKFVKEIVQTILIPMAAVLIFFVWSYSLIRSQPPKILVFPLSSIIITALYFFSGPVYSGVMLAFVTVAGFLSIFLTDSQIDRVVFLAETLWLWGLFLLYEYYQKTYDNLENRKREEEEVLRSDKILLSSKIEDSRKRSSDLSQRITNYQSLGKMAHLLGQTLEEEKIIPLLGELAARFIGKGNWKVKQGAHTDIFAQYVKANNIPLIVSNLLMDTRFQIKHPRFLSLIAVPLEVNGKFWGIIKGAAAKDGYFDESDLRTLSVLGGIASLALNNAKLYQRTQDLSITDGLTGLYVQSYFKERLVEEITRSFSHNLPLSVAVIDIDHFKKVNDTYGHAAGDVVLRQVADILRHRFRETDFVSRYGGEEFGVVMPQTDPAEAFSVIEEIRKSIEAEKIFLPVESFHPVQIKITVSAGLASIREKHLNDEELFKLADNALYAAKSGGRNKTVIAK